MRRLQTLHCALWLFSAVIGVSCSSNEKHKQDLACWERQTLLHRAIVTELLQTTNHSDQDLSTIIRRLDDGRRAILFTCPVTGIKYSINPHSTRDSLLVSGMMDDELLIVCAGHLPNLPHAADLPALTFSGSAVTTNHLPTWASTASTPAAPKR